MSMTLVFYFVISLSVSPIVIANRMPKDFDQEET
jgi:hypothetical protein